MSDETTLATVETTPLTMIEQAISQGIEPEKLGKLLDLQERWEKNQAIKAYSSAMNACEMEMPAVVRDRKNEHTRSLYATLDAVLTTIKPVYSRHGFSVSFNEVECAVPDSLKIEATVRHTGGHSEKFSAIVPMDGVGVKGVANKTAIQGKGSSLTYARRYLTLMIFSIALADEDTDGNTEDATLTDEQVYYLQGLINDCEDAGDPVSMKRFFATCRIHHDDAELGDIKQMYYDACKRGLSDKLAKAQKGVPS